MNKKIICNFHETFAYYSGFGGVELKHIEYDIEDTIYFTTNSWYGKPSYHKSKVYYNKSGNAYIKLNGIRIPLNECIRIKL